MESKTLYQIASLVMALVMILGNTIHKQAVPVAAVASPSIYWGASVNADVPSSTNMQGSYNTFEMQSENWFTRYDGQDMATRVLVGKP